MLLLREEGTNDGDDNIHLHMNMNIERWQTNERVSRSLCCSPFAPVWEWTVRATSRDQSLSERRLRRFVRPCVCMYVCLYIGDDSHKLYSRAGDLETRFYQTNSYSFIDGVECKYKSVK